MVEGRTFRPEHRLRRPAEFAAVMASPLRIRGEHFELRYRHNDGAAARLGLIVPKRLAKTAALRNLLKRLIREAFRTMRMQMPAEDVVVRLLKPTRIDKAAVREQRRRWRAEVDGLLARLPR